MKSINLKKFNSNLIDPIKLLFDKKVFNKTFDEIIRLEIHRQRDKSNSNIIGYFHQNIFNYIKDCTVPKQGWDIIYETSEKVYYVEMKNKHNTMNSAATAKTYMRMQNHLLNSEDKDISICALVEVIAKKSQDIPWVIYIDSEKQMINERLRRISIDKFYEIITGNREAFNLICRQLPITIDKLIDKNENLQIQDDSVLEELYNIDSDILNSLYKLAFSTYEGFQI